ncbi:MAG: holin family protein, partial [Pseudomonadales bacterium]|nr:holin family protein [Pseudomonadales bacterium]
MIAETVEVFKPNSEKDAQRSAEIRKQAMTQFSQEFGQPGIINALADGMNRMGRPVITYGVIALFCSAMWSPTWFAARMQGLTLVPEPLWIIFGAIVSFFFGAREFSKIRSASLAKEAARIADATPTVIRTVKELNSLAPGA